MGLLRRRAEAADDSPGVPGPEPAPRRDWADLPPMPRFGDELRPMLDTRFEQHLASWQSPAVTRPLDHAVRGDGPRGVGVQPVAAPVTAEPGPMEPVPETVGSPMGTWAPKSDPTVASATPAIQATATSTATPAIQPATAASTATTAIQTATTATAASTAAPATPATVAPATARPLGLGPPLSTPVEAPATPRRPVQRLAVSPPPPALAPPRVDSPSHGAEPSGPEPEGAGEAVPPPAEMRPVDPTAGDESPAVSEPLDDEPASTRPVLAQAAPLPTASEPSPTTEVHAVSEPPTVQALVAEPSSRVLPRKHPTGVQHVASPTPPDPPTTERGDGATPVQAEAAPPGPSLEPDPAPAPAALIEPDVGAATPSGPGDPPEPPASRPESSPAAIERTAVERTAIETAPTLGSIVSTQRAAAPQPLPSVQRTAGAERPPALPVPTTVQTMSAAPELVAPLSFARTPAVTVHPALPTTTPAASTAKPSPYTATVMRTAVPPSNEMAPPGAAANPAAAASAPPATTTPTRWTDAGAVAVAAGVAQRQADGSVVFPTPSSDVVSRDADEIAAAEPEASAPTTAPTTAPAATRPATAVDPAMDLDELAKRLYGRLRVMLKHELRLDRERAGLITQARR
jgi:hypothetical protein